MKIINLPRGYGKTTRLLYASEFNNIPILCANKNSKQVLLDNAKMLNLKIPEPITPSEIITGSRFEISQIGRDRDILIDEVPVVLQSLLDVFGFKCEVKAITLTSDEQTGAKDEK